MIWKKPNRGDRQIFQSRKMIKPVTVSLYDVRDAFEATENLSRADREDYFEARGIDYEHSVAYYDFVRKLDLDLDSVKFKKLDLDFPSKLNLDFPSKLKKLDLDSVNFSMIWSVFYVYFLRNSATFTAFSRIIKSQK